MANYYLGVDVSKGYADFILIDQKKRVIEKVFQLDDTFEGHCTLTDFLHNFLKQHINDCIYAGLESTGGYENNWHSMLCRLSEIMRVNVARLNPLGVKKHHEAALNKNVTDSISAHTIASYLIGYSDRIRYNEGLDMPSLRKQWNLVQLLTKQRTQLVNHVGFLLYQSNPGLVRYCKKGTPQWVLSLLVSYPTANKLARARASTVAKIPGITSQRAKDLIADAKESIASHMDETDEFIIRNTIQHIKSLDTLINSHKKHMEKSCSVEEVKLICSFKGIGVYSAIGLWLNIISISRFLTSKKLASYFGLHPVYKESGDKSWGFHMSKQGRKQPRSILFMVALSAIAQNPLIRKLYAKKLSQGMDKMAAVGVCMHKILRIVYGMLKSNTAYDPQIDEKNQQKGQIKNTKNNQPVTDKKRRHQHIDSGAPISKRQQKRRIKAAGSQKPQENNVLMNGVIPTLPIYKSILCTVGRKGYTEISKN